MPTPCPEGQRKNKDGDCVPIEAIKTKPLESEYHTYGLPDNLYTAEGDSLPTVGVDEEMFSKINKTDSTVTAIGSGPGYKKGQVFHLRGKRTTE
tara:strand:- start:2298 stop:2579 length:282 start_codon:yes stop_codon:yes gene_type:complete